MTGGPLTEGEWVRLSDAKGRKHNIQLVAGAEFSTKKGQIRHDDIIGRPEGVVLESSLGGQYQVFRPLLSEYVVSMPRGAAVDAANARGETPLALAAALASCASPGVREPDPDDYRIYRGDTHRHTELSFDGNNDVYPEWDNELDTGGGCEESCEVHGDDDQVAPLRRPEERAGDAEGDDEAGNATLTWVLAIVGFLAAGLFAAVNLVRAYGIAAEDALRAANDKFERRYRAMEALAEYRKVPGEEHPSVVALRTGERQHGVLLGSHTQLVVEGVVPDLLHVVPVRHDAVLDRVLQGQDT